MLHCYDLRQLHRESKRLLRTEFFKGLWVAQWWTHYLSCLSKVSLNLAAGASGTREQRVAGTTTCSVHLIILRHHITKI